MIDPSIDQLLLLDYLTIRHEHKDIIIINIEEMCHNTLKLYIIIINYFCSIQNNIFKITYFYNNFL